jgi:trehalose/maltose hydrolase-like predicted phosphorylase
VAILQRALDRDAADVQGGTTAEGVHLGAMAARSTSFCAA